MNFLTSIFLGLVQGLAEFLPISSSGHLSLFQNFFGLTDAGMFFDVLLHLGTMVSVFVVSFSMRRLMRLPFWISMAGPWGLVSVSPFRVTLAL